MFVVARTLLLASGATQLMWRCSPTTSWRNMATMTAQLPSP